MLNGVLSPALPFKVLEQAIPPASVSLVADSKTGSLEARHGDATHSDTEVDFFLSLRQRRSGIGPVVSRGTFESLHAENQGRANKKGWIQGGREAMGSRLGPPPL